MESLKLIATILLLPILFVACSGNSAPNAGKDNAAPIAATADASPSQQDASFSCILDGKEFSGKGTDQNINAAFHLTGDDNGKIFFRLSDMNNVGEKLNFSVPEKIGSTTFSVTPTSSFIGYMTTDFVNYLDDPIIVTISSFTSSRVAGTFSGKYTLQKGSGSSNSKQTIEVTDGKFDIPFSTSAQWKQMYHAE
jgi:hypothetical protein